MTKQRLVVSNGSKTLEKEYAGAWSVVRCEAAGALKSGVYNLYAAQPVFRPSQQTFTGTVLHADSDRVYQAVAPGRLVAFERRAFERVPPIGQHVTINYAHGRAAVAGPEAARER